MVTKNNGRQGSRTDKGDKMRISELYSSIGYDSRRSKCNKVCYSEREDATTKAAQHRNDIVCFESMNVYWCPDHQSWHIGHSHKSKAATLQFEEDLEFFQSFGQQN